MTLKIKMASLGIVQTNTFVIGDTTTGEAVVIDPVDDAPFIYGMAEEEGWTVRLILATHGHFDHVLASKHLKELTGAPFWIHEADAVMLHALPEQGLRFLGTRFPEAAIPDQLLSDQPEPVKVSAIELECLFTPGHSPGHLAFYLRSHHLVFSGDCLFAGSIGRTDLPGGNYPLLIESIMTKLIPLGDETHVLPGHGPATTIGRERMTNPFLNESLM